MNVKVLTVTDSSGQTSKTDSSGQPIDFTGYCGVYVDGAGKNDPYQFYAMEAPYNKDNPPPAVGAVKPLPVQIVLPLGGNLSGIYRYPKIGEKVLVYCAGVGDASAKNYLLRCIPSADNPFFSGTDALPDEVAFAGEGEVIRYKNNAEAFCLKDYSEIVLFKNDLAEWPATAGETDYPSIDTIGFDSAGNLRENTANHHLQQGKRIEILVDTPEMDHTTCKVDSAGTLPLGDYPGDDSYLHKGDIHIRAGNRELIKAAREIRLQVGRTLLRIGDDGFNVITRNVCGNYINSYDTSLNMTPRDGIALNGKNINLQAGRRLNMGDGMGGTLAATMGNISISGRELNLDSSNSMEYKFMAMFQGLEYLVNSASAGMALSGEVDIRIAEYIKFTTDNLKSLIQLGKRFNSVWGERKNVRNKITELENAPGPEPDLEPTEADLEALDGVYNQMRKEFRDAQRALDAAEHERDEASVQGPEPLKPPEEPNEQDGPPRPPRPMTAAELAVLAGAGVSVEAELPRLPNTEAARRWRALWRDIEGGEEPPPDGRSSPIPDNPPEPLPDPIPGPPRPPQPPPDPSSPQPPRRPPPEWPFPIDPRDKDPSKRKPPEGWTNNPFW
jgi:hypothetical protein